MNEKTVVRRSRRFRGYDYSRGAVLFVTFGLRRRRLIFGRVEGDKVVYNAVGEAAVETMQREMKRNPDLVVHRFVIMPDHVHLRVYIRTGAKDPLREVGRFVANFKRWSRWKAEKLGVELDWEENYYDRICLSAEIIDLVDKYIDNNALKWWLMHTGSLKGCGAQDGEPVDGARSRHVCRAPSERRPGERSDAWHGINDVIAEFSETAVYVVRNKQTGEIDWRFQINTDEENR